MHRDTGTQIGQSTDFDRCPINDHDNQHRPTDDHDQPARRYDHSHDNQHRPTDDHDQPARRYDHSHDQPARRNDHNHDNFAGSARLAG